MQKYWRDSGENYDRFCQRQAALVKNKFKVFLAASAPIKLKSKEI